MGKSTTFILNLQENLANLKLDFKFTKNPFTLSLVTVSFLIVARRAYRRRLRRIVAKRIVPVPVNVIVPVNVLCP
jgi:hypothetical protein